MSRLRAQEIAKQLSAALAPHREILEAYLFGSLGRGDDQPHSDVDVAVFVSESALDQPGLGYQVELGTALQQVLGRSDVDVVVLNQAAPVLYHAVLRDGVRLLSRDLAATTRREGHALSRYCDDVPRLRRIDAIHRARIAAGDFGT